MIDRRLMRDIAVAVLLAVPTVALARPQAAARHAAPSVQPLVEQAAMADRTGAERRFAL
ncbi:MAG: hypothetical protein ABIS38_03055 [Sphingomicrobium sp.]